jgi:hypothetical protein
MAAVLSGLLAQSKCEYVFTSLHDHSVPLSVNTFADQHRTIMETCSFHPDAGLHALRHTFLTEAGRHTQNVRALQKLAGHSKIETTMRYVHPDDAGVLEIARAVQHARSQEDWGVTTVFTTQGSCETPSLLKSGHFTSLRSLFAFSQVNEWSREEAQWR